VLKRQSSFLWISSQEKLTPI